MTADKKLAYTDTIIVHSYTMGYKTTEVITIINLKDLYKKIYSINGSEYNLMDVIFAANEAKTGKLTYTPNLLFLNAIKTQKFTPNMLIYANKFTNLNSSLYPIVTKDKKYFLRATNYNIYIAVTKEQIKNPKRQFYKKIPIVKYQGDGDYDDNKANIIVNGKMDRIMVVGQNLELYKIDFTHLPKTYEDIKSKIIYGIVWDYKNYNKFPKFLDPKDRKGETYIGYGGSLSLSSDDNYVAAGYADEKKKYTGWVRSINTGFIRYLLTGDAVFSTAWSPNGKYLVTLGKYISIRDAKTGKTIQTIGTKGPEIDRGPFFTQDGKLLFSDKNFDMHVVTLP